MSPRHTPPPPAIRRLTAARPGTRHVGLDQGFCHDRRLSVRVHTVAAHDGPQTGAGVTRYTSPGGDSDHRDPPPGRGGGPSVSGTGGALHRQAVVAVVRVCPGARPRSAPGRSSDRV
ncbi:hypothetical protein LI90_3412 [Carbonactinospora thermoautotrophica]|uniref:Uncharacterized protein n=1 Tax=Carbonactinospora thermoautotrophica TaxID=1469144 RepID=A0A132MWY4_9ACTN|nr:hypothetical protein LI90_3412 [Carbonactinospora thermoautotrophica]